MKEIIFKSDSAQILYSDYLARIKKNISILSKEDQVDMLMEINSHIYESLQVENEKDEVEKLIDITQKLGQPEEFLSPIIAEKKVNQAGRTFKPIHVWQALKLNFSRGGFYVVQSLLYLLLVVFGFLIIVKIVAPSNTGLFYQSQKFEAFGYISNPEGMTEVLGFWLIPLAIVAATIFYLLITLLFRLKRK